MWRIGHHDNTIIIFAKSAYSEQISMQIKNPVGIRSSKQSGRPLPFTSSTSPQPHEPTSTLLGSRGHSSLQSYSSACSMVSDQISCFASFILLETNQ